MTYTVDAYGVRFTIDMTGTGDYVNRVENMDDPTGDWDCSPPVDGENEPNASMWMKAYVKQLVDHETNRTSWDERQKNSVALRAKLQTMADRGEIDE
jgi:hypothetical protein